MITKIIEKFLRAWRKSKGFVSKKGGYLDYVELHVLGRGMIFPFLAICFHAWFGIDFLLWTDAVLVPFALGLDVTEASNKWLGRLREESHYFLQGHVPIFLGYGVWLMYGDILVKQVILVCL